MFWTLVFSLGMWGMAYLLDNKTFLAKLLKMCSAGLVLLCTLAIVNTTCTAFLIDGITKDILMLTTLIIGASKFAYVYSKRKIFAYIGIILLTALAAIFGAYGIILSL